MFEELERSFEYTIFSFTNNCIILIREKYLEKTTKSVKRIA